MGDNEERLLETFFNDGWDSKNPKKCFVFTFPDNKAGKEWIGIVVQHKTATIGKGRPDFSTCEFSLHYPVAGLCGALQDSGVNVSTLIELNRLLCSPKLYDKVLSYRSGQEPSEVIRESYDAYQKSQCERDLKIFNRALLEEYYPDKCPKSQDKSYDYKTAYYVEGSPYAMGYLMGRMAEPVIADICTYSARSIIREFVKGKSQIIPEQRRIKFLEDKAKKWSSSFFGCMDHSDDVDNPEYKRYKKYEQFKQYKEELKGMFEGCKRENTNTRVTEEALWLLNVGFDAIIAHIYGDGQKKYLFESATNYQNFRIPLMCNGFSVSGDIEDRSFHFMGRDFMFPMGDILPQHVAPIIYNPTGGQQFVSLSVPGIIGSFAGMNINGVGIGANMSPAGNCNSDDPGVNSILLSRHAVQNGDNLDNTITIIDNAPRGVPWMYIVADGSMKKHRSCVIEAGKYEAPEAFIAHLEDYPHQNIWDNILTDFERKLKLSTPGTFRNGMMVRDQDYPCNQLDIYDFYQRLNKSLVDDFTNMSQNIPMSNDDNPYFYMCGPYTYLYDSKDWNSTRFINDNYAERNCPMTHYFPPIRNDESGALKGNVLIVTNFFMIPEMRLCQMYPNTSILAQDLWDEMQWRYDELNRLLRTNYDKMQRVQNDKAYEIAQNIINFLSPLSLGSSDFRAEEFQNGFTIEGLCGSLNRDGFPPGTNTLASLNELLRLPELYKNLISHKTIKASHVLKKMIENYEKDIGASLLKIELINRLALEECYPGKPRGACF